MLKVIQVPVYLLLVSWLFVLSICNCCTTNLKLKGLTYLKHEDVTCTLVECNCCNTCHGLISFITANDTILLTGELNGEPILCKGSDCELRNNNMNCAPLGLNKKYEITGNFVTVGKGIAGKLFNVIAFQKVN